MIKIIKLLNNCFIFLYNGWIIDNGQTCIDNYSNAVRLNINQKDKHIYFPVKLNTELYFYYIKM